MFLQFFLQNFSNAPNCTILKKFLGGACPRTPLAKAWLRHALHGAKHLQIPAPLSQKYFEPPPPK